LPDVVLRKRNKKGKRKERKNVKEKEERGTIKGKIELKGYS
jgi:hypothetical protein